MQDYVLPAEEQGLAVTTARYGPEAIERVKERRFDATFLDIKMPLMDGVEIYRRIKEIRPEAVVMITAYAVEDFVQEALQEGVYGILYKPLEIRKVVMIIEEARGPEEGHSFRPLPMALQRASP